MDCLFCKIVAGEIPAEIVYESETAIGFRDINAQAPTHVLVIPRKEIVSIDHIQSDDQPLLGHIWSVIPAIAKQLGLDNGYRVVVNCGQEGGQEVPHLHFHLLGGRRLSWPPG